MRPHMKRFRPPAVFREPRFREPGFREPCSSDVGSFCVGALAVIFVCVFKFVFPGSMAPLALGPRLDRFHN